jgi:hypothetical protein
MSESAHPPDGVGGGCARVLAAVVAQLDAADGPLERVRAARAAREQVQELEQAMKALLYAEIAAARDTGPWTNKAIGEAAGVADSYVSRV